MKKISLLLCLLLVSIFMIFSQKKEHVNGLVLYKSEISSYSTLKKYLNKEANVNLKLDYVIDDSQQPDNKDLWEHSREELKVKLNSNEIDLLLDIPNDYLRNFIKNDTLLKLDNYISTDNIYPSVLDKCKKIGNGNIYFISPYFSTNFLIVNTVVLDKLNIEVPNEIMSWDDASALLNDINNSINVNSLDDTYALSLGINGLESFFQDFEVLTRSFNLPVKSGNNIYENEDWFNVFSYFMNLYKDYSINKEVYTPELFLEDKIAIKFVQGPEIDFYKDSMSKYKIFEVPSYKEYKKQIHLETLDVSIPANSPNKKSALKVLNIFLSEEFASKNIDENIWGGYGSYPFVSYVDDNILNKYKSKYNLTDSKIIYSKKPGYANIQEFLLLNDYAIFQQSSREVVPSIIKGNISIGDGFYDIKERYLKYSKND